jgi:intein/homing endonuclease
MESKCLENDTCEIVSDKIEEVYELEIEDGRTIKATADHPFLVENEDGEIIEKKLIEIAEGDEIISF